MSLEKNKKDCIFIDENKLIRSIKKHISKYPCIISIDGVDGVGKSTLACRIKKELGFSHLEIDTYVQKRQGGYIDHIGYEQLSVTIKHAIAENHDIIIEGICVQQVLSQLNINSNVRVYIRVKDSYGFWMDQMRFFPPEKTADEMIAERKRKGFPFGHVEDIIRYHYTFKPYEKADYILERLKA